MQFNVKEWRKIYDKVNYLGQVIKDANEHQDADGNWNPPVSPISPGVRKVIEDEIKALLIQSKNSLDSVGLRPYPALWIYNKDDPATWPSHDSFKFNHLIKYKGKKCKNGCPVQQQLG